MSRCGLEPLPIKVSFYRASVGTPNFTYPFKLVDRWDLAYPQLPSKCLSEHFGRTTHKLVRLTSTTLVLTSLVGPLKLRI